MGGGEGRRSSRKELSALQPVWQSAWRNGKASRQASTRGSHQHTLASAPACAGCWRRRAAAGQTRHAGREHWPPQLLQSAWHLISWWYVSPKSTCIAVHARTSPSTRACCSSWWQLACARTSLCAVAVLCMPPACSLPSPCNPFPHRPACTAAWKRAGLPACPPQHRYLSLVWAHNIAYSIGRSAGNAVHSSGSIVFCSLCISPGWCHRWAIVPADSLKGKETRFNFLLFN